MPLTGERKEKDEVSFFFFVCISRVAMFFYFIFGSVEWSGHHSLFFLSFIFFLSFSFTLFICITFKKKTRCDLHGRINRTVLIKNHCGLNELFINTWLHTGLVFWRFFGKLHTSKTHYRSIGVCMFSLFYGSLFHLDWKYCYYIAQVFVKQ